VWGRTKHRPDDVRRDPPQRLTLGKGFANQGEFVVLKVAQAAVDQLGRFRRCALGEVLGLEQQHPGSPPGGITGNSGTVDAAADHCQVEYVVHAAGLAG
jgi:hypothetical protein